MPERVTSDGIRLRSLAPGPHSSKETPQRQRAIDDTVSALTGPAIEPEAFRADIDAFNHKADSLIFCNYWRGRSKESRVCWFEKLVSAFVKYYEVAVKNLI